jgi:hypothetical protein
LFNFFLQAQSGGALGWHVEEAKEAIRGFVEGGGAEEENALPKSQATVSSEVGSAESQRGSVVN